MLFRSILEKKPISMLTVSYIVALALLAGMSLGAHYVVKRVIYEQKESARTINVAGRQRMLSQRTTLFLTDLVDHNSPHALINLTQSLKLFEKSHKALTVGDEDIGLSGEVPEALFKIYYKEPYNLDVLVKKYTQDIREIIQDAQLNEGNFDNVKVEEIRNLAKGKLLSTLDLAVKNYEEIAEAKIARLVDIQTASIICILILIMLEALIIFRPLIRKVKEYASKIEEYAITDDLTGAFNRRSIFEFISKEISRSNRYEYDFSLVICDIDQFKEVNDTYGHTVGDAALRHFVDILQANMRKEDILGRFGGEEFMIILPQTDNLKAKRVTEKLRLALEKTPLEVEENGAVKEIKVTASFGLVTYDEKIDKTSDEIYARADKAVYEAKEQGRNRVVTG